MPIISGGVGGLPGVTLSGTPQTGQMIFATSPTAADWEALTITQVGHGAKDTAWLPTGGTSHAGDDEFNTGALDASWTQLTSGGASNVTSVGADVFSVACSGGNAVAFSGGLVKAITIAQGGYIEAALRLAGPAATQPVEAGIYFADAATNTANIVSADININTNLLAVRSSTFNNTSVLSSVQVGATFWKTLNIYIRLTWVAANTFRAQIGTDGVTFSAFGMADQARVLTPTHMGLCWGNFGAGTGLYSFEYFRCSG